MLNALAADLEAVECNAVLKKSTYIRLPKPISEYEEDDHVQQCINHRPLPLASRYSVYPLGYGIPGTHTAKSPKTGG